MPADDGHEPVTLIVDGANVMGSRADGWWRDPAAAMARLHAELGSLAARGIDGPPPDGGPERSPAAGGVPGRSAGGTGAAGGAETSGGTGAVGGAETSGGTGAAGGEEAAAGRWFPSIILVVEGKAARAVGRITEARGVRVVAATGAGDDEIARLAASVPGKRIVITADRELRSRSQRAGASVTGPRWLIRQFA